jgi:hypothetical protein
MSGARRIRRRSGRRGAARLRGLEVAMEAAAEGLDWSESDSFSSTALYCVLLCILCSL